MSSSRSRYSAAFRSGASLSDESRSPYTAHRYCLLSQMTLSARSTSKNESSSKLAQRTSIGSVRGTSRVRQTRPFEPGREASWRPWRNDFRTRSGCASARPGMRRRPSRCSWRSDSLGGGRFDAATKSALTVPPSSGIHRDLVGEAVVDVHGRLQRVGVFGWDERPRSTDRPGAVDRSGRSRSPVR